MLNPEYILKTMTNNKQTNNLYKAKDFRVKLLYGDNLETLQRGINDWLNENPERSIIELSVQIVQNAGRYAIIKYLV